ncbi:hypothetical protein Trydic_g5015 [Trypoxylus dichotomus]
MTEVLSRALDRRRWAWKLWELREYRRTFVNSKLLLPKYLFRSSSKVDWERNKIEEEAYCLNYELLASCDDYWFWKSLQTCLLEITTSL